MKNLLKNEWQKVKFPFWLVFLLSIITVSMTTFTTYKTYQIEQQLQVYEVGFEYFILFYALVCVIPTAWLMYFERKTYYVKYILPRAKQRTYILVKAFMSMVIGFVMIFGISLISLIIALYIVPEVPERISSFDLHTGAPISVREMRIFGDMFVEHPFYYGFISSVWKGFIGSLIGLFGFVLSVFSRNLFVILTGPFLYTIIENYSLSAFGLEEFRLVTSFEPSTIYIKDFTWASALAGPALLVVVVFVYVLYLRMIKKKSTFEL
ncbi:hypothetical protein [Bacillus sp. OK048]|uniref:hypothetical protein n=1 Tax=Bacillus sp. OK048 TaxID=1882761 RepID=UPI000882DC3F|nr:hypothetical protein [Bacillus sp. OK048]SDM16001.1 hypothetical protein SAMN05443253_102111 [Bacillus sp. OK048]